jgi:hypothetical protein
VFISAPPTHLDLQASRAPVLLLRCLEQPSLFGKNESESTNKTEKRKSDTTERDKPDKTEKDKPEKTNTQDKQEIDLAVRSSQLHLRSSDATDRLAAEKHIKETGQQMTRGCITLYECHSHPLYHTRIVSDQNSNEVEMRFRLSRQWLL